MLGFIFDCLIDTIQVLDETERTTSQDGFNLKTFWIGFQAVWSKRTNGKSSASYIRDFCQAWIKKVGDKSSLNPLDALLLFITDHSGHVHLVRTGNKRRKGAALDPESTLITIDWPTISLEKASHKRLHTKPRDIIKRDFEKSVNSKMIISVDALCTLILTHETSKQELNQPQPVNLLNQRIEKLLEDVQMEEWYSDQMQLYREEPREVKRTFMQHQDRLHPSLVQAVIDYTDESNVEDGKLHLYVHQVQALDALLQGNDVCLSTATASGKSLVFQVHAINLLLASLDNVSIVVYPTKALAQDQLTKWNELLLRLSEIDPYLPEIRVAVVDGDTDYSDRKELTSTAHILLTNLDFIHKTALMTKNQYMRLLKHLRFLVVDEAHMYRGVFGAHSSLCLRRLLLMSHHIQDPETREAELARFVEADELPLKRTQIITCTATLGNPLHHFGLLTGRKTCVCVQEDGSPAEAKYFALWDPPKVVAGTKSNPAIITLQDLWGTEVLPSTVDYSEETDEAKKTRTKPVERLEDDPQTRALEHQIRFDLKITEENETFKLSAINEAIKIFLFMVQRKVKIFLFCNARILVEIIFNTIQKKLAKQKDLLDKIVSYRGGYTKDTRRSLERRIFRNEAYGVISTNALELGIDLGLLDVVITLGFEGSVSSVRQRLGRAGRSQRPSLGFLVAFDSPVERFVVKKLGNSFWQKKPEPVIFDPYNMILQKQHLVCALKELGEPIDSPELVMFMGESINKAIEVALRTGEIRRLEDGKLKFAVTSRALIVSDGNEYEYALDTERKLLERPAAVPVPTTFSIKIDDVIGPRYPFLSDAHREGKKGGKVDDEMAFEQHLREVLEKATPTLLKDEKGEVKDKPVFFLNDLTHWGAGRQFKDPHPIVDLRSSGIPNVSVYVISKAAEARFLNWNYEEAGGFKLNKMDGLTQIDEITLWNAWYQVFPGAVYTIRGRDLLVKVFNFRERYCVASEEKGLGFTTNGSEVHNYRMMKIDRVLSSTDGFTPLSPSVRVFLGTLRVKLSIPSYWRVFRDGSKKKPEKVDLSLPDLAYDTRGLAVDLSETIIHKFYNKASYLLNISEAVLAFKSRASDKEGLLIAAMHGLGHALTKTATAVVWCDQRELDCNCASPLLSYGRDQPRIYLFEKPSSIALGIADILFKEGGVRLQELFMRAQQVFVGCDCTRDPTSTGCLDCVLLPQCLERNAMIHGKAAQILLNCVLGVHDSD